MDVRGTLETLSTDLSPTERERLAAQLSVYLNDLLVNDFAALVQLLYTVDISEKKLKTVLVENPGADAGDLLAELLIERQREKMLTLQQFSQHEPPSEEAW